MLFFSAVITLFLLAVIYYDATSYIIPNWISGLLLALFPAMLLMTPSFPANFSPWISLGVFAVVFVFGIGIFMMSWAGGGDVKLLAVLSLWTGIESVAEFLIYTSLLGGAMSLGLLLVRPMAGRLCKTDDPEKLPRILRPREPLPYGVAITFGFLIVLWLGKVPCLPFSVLNA